MSIYRIFLITSQIFFIFILSHTVFAEPSLTVEEAVRVALKNRYELSIAEKEVQKGNAQLVEAKSELYTKLDIIGSNSYTETINKFEPIEISFDFMGTEYNIIPTRDIPDYRSSISMKLTQRLFSGGRITNQIEGAKERIGQTEMAKKVVERDVILSVIKAYWELKRAEKVLEIEKEKVQWSETILKVSNAMYEKGAISGLEREKAEVDATNNHGDLLQAETMRRIAEDRLLREMGIIGTDREFSVVLQDKPIYDFSKPDDEVIKKTIEMALTLRSEMKQIKAYVKANKADVGVARSYYYPQVDLVGEYNWIGYSKDSIDDSWRDIERNYWLVMLRVNFNLFEGFATKSKVNRAKAELSASMLEMAKQRQMIIQEVRQAYNTLFGAAGRVGIFQRNIALAKKNMKAALKRFELGAATMNQVAEYNLSLAETRKRFINALIDYEIAKAELRWASGEDMP